MEKIGFIGLGIMGKPMALNLLKAGYSVSILSQSKAATELIEAGAKAHNTTQALAEDNTIIITMLPDSPDVEKMVNSIAASMQSGALFIDMSTISPLVAKNSYNLLKNKGISALDAPVSGGQVGAVAATLSIMVGGDSAAFERACPLFQAMGKNIIHIGEAGAGQTTKACNQMIVGMTIQAVAEAFALAKKAGVDLEKMREVLLGGFAQSRILDLHGKRMIEGNFKPGFKVKLHKKDMGIALKTGKQFDVPLKGTAQVAKQMKIAVEKGHGELDHSALFLLLDDEK
jgi:2-hydroxy-3-oxopropionate reductase